VPGVITDEAFLAVCRNAHPLKSDATEPPELRLEMRIFDEAGFDSLARVEVIAVLEATYGAVIEQEDLASCETLQDLLDLGRRHASHSGEG